MFWESFPAVRYRTLHEEFTRAVEQRRFVKFEEYAEPLGRWYGCRCYPIDGGLTILLHDITARKEMEARPHTLNDHLEEEVQAQMEELQDTVERLQEEVARQIRFHLPGTRVVALSMYEDKGVRERMRHAGAEAYVLKTAPPEALLAPIRGQSRA